MGLRDLLRKDWHKTKERRAKKWRRTKRQFKYFVATFLTLEGLLATACLPRAFKGEHAFTQNNTHAARISLGSLAYLWHNTPRGIGLSSPNHAEIELAFQHPRTRDALEDLMRRDDAQSYSEIQGLVTLDYENDMPFLRFYERPTLNARAAAYLQANKQDPRALTTYIQDNLDLFSTVTDIGQDELQDMLDRGEMEHITRRFLRRSDDYSCDSRTTRLLFYYHHMHKIQGAILGQFHTHNDASPPSPKDLDNSRRERQLVLVRGVDRYELYLLEQCERTVPPPHTTTFK